MKEFDSIQNYKLTKEKVGYIDFEKAQPSDYSALGFKSGLEIHQQLLTDKKLFCRCPAGIYQRENDYEAEVIRHMRPTLSELGEYDGTALMEFKTRKNIVYRLKNITACTYDIDDTPPFYINQQALDIAIEITLIAKQSIVGELHITRKQYLDGSIPTGFQRTGIVGIEGEIPISNKKIRLIQLSLEEDSCREVSDIGHERIYRTDRLGMPLIETVTYPDMLTPQEVAEAAQYLRFLVRSTGKVRVGIGAAREDVNVSIDGGTRVEIKGVAHIKLIPKLTHNEPFRQKPLLEIKKELLTRIKKPVSWNVSYKILDFVNIKSGDTNISKARASGKKLVAVNLPNFKGILSFFTQPGQTFANELSDRLKVVACLDHPNMITSEMPRPEFFFANGEHIAELLKIEDNDAQIIFWCHENDLKTAVETIEERCQMAFEGVPNETRKSLPDGTTIFERVLPGADRMYPDTDTAPIAIPEKRIEKIKANLPVDVFTQKEKLSEWKVPKDCYTYILRNNLMGLIERIVNECDENPAFVCKVFAHNLNHLEGQITPSSEFNYKKIYGLFKYLKENSINTEIIKEMLPEVYAHPNIEFESVLVILEFNRTSRDELLGLIPTIVRQFSQIRESENDTAEHNWVMGQIRKRALGNISLSELSGLIRSEVGHV